MSFFANDDSATPTYPPNILIVNPENIEPSIDDGLDGVQGLFNTQYSRVSYEINPNNSEVAIVKMVLMVTWMEIRITLIELIMLRSHKRYLTLLYSM